MAGWTASTLMPQTVKKVGNRKHTMTTPVVQASAVVPGTPQSVMGANVTDPRLLAEPITSPVTSPLVPPASENIPPFLTGGSDQTGDVLSLISEIMGLNQPAAASPDLVQAQTALAREQAVQARLANNQVQNQMAQQSARSYLQSQMRDASKYTTGSVGNILTQRYQDRANVLQNQGELNWLNMPASTFSVPRRRGWVGPAMPGVWGF